MTRLLPRVRYWLTAKDENELRPLRAGRKQCRVLVRHVGCMGSCLSYVDSTSRWNAALLDYIKATLGLQYAPLSNLRPACRPRANRRPTKESCRRPNKSCRDVLPQLRYRGHVAKMRRASSIVHITSTYLTVADNAIMETACNIGGHGTGKQSSLQLSKITRDEHHDIYLWSTVIEEVQTQHKDQPTQTLHRDTKSR